MLHNKRNIFFISLLVTIWCMMLLVTNPTGNFPLNDDWMYARTVHSFVDLHNYYITDEYSPVLVAQVWWGALFCLPFGFSFIALRVSVIVLGILGIVFFYLLLYKLSGNKILSFFCALLIACNPLYFCLANSFMSDVPFLSFSIMAIYCFICALQKPTVLIFIAATATAILSTLTRQFGIIIPISFAIMGLLQRRRHIALRIACVVPLILVFWLLWFTLGRLQGKGYNPYGGTDIAAFLKSPDLIMQLLKRCGLVLYYTGFCLLPFLLMLGSPFRGLTPKQKWIAGVFMLVFVPTLVTAWNSLPVGNVFNFGYLGPFTVKGWVDDRQLMPGLRLMLGCIAAFGALLLLARIGVLLATSVQAVKKGFIGEKLKLKTFIAMCILGYGALSCVPDFFFDRYILYLFPLFILLLMPEQSLAYEVKRPIKAVAYVFTFLLLAFAVAGTHDYLSWNRVRWQVVSELTKNQNISIHKIDAGYEVNGWMLGKWYPLQLNKSWWFVDDDEYVISTEPHGLRYNDVKAYPYSRYLPFGSGNVYVWKKKVNIEK